MFNGRPIHPLARVAIIVVVGYLLLTQAIHYALLPVVLALVAWGGYQIYKSERRITPRPASRNPFDVRRVRRARPSVRAIRIDPDKDLTVPKDWR